MQWLRKCKLLAPWVVFGLSLFVLAATGRVIAAMAANAVVPSPGAGKFEEKTKKTETTIGPFTGTVVDAAGKPVAGAKVWLLGGYLAGPRVVAETISDEKGQFRIEAVKWATPSDGTASSLPKLLARDSRGRIGGQVQRLISAREPPPKPFIDLQLKLQEAKEYRGRLTDAAGQPIADATVRPTLWTHEHEEDGQRSQETILFSADLRRELTAKTAADGTVQLRNLPPAGRITLQIDAKGFGKPQARVNLEKSATIQLAKVGSLRGSVTCDKEPKAAAGILVQINISSAERTLRRGPAQPDCEVFYSQSVVTQKDGTFLIENIPPGRCFLWLPLLGSLPYYVADFGAVTVKSGETAKVSLALNPAVKLHGKVVDGQTGQGVPDVFLFLNFTDRKGTGRIEMQTPRTDAKGEFTILTRPGKAFLQVSVNSAEYMSPGNSEQRIVELTRDTTLEPIRLTRARLLQGIVVTASGKPVADAKIYYTSLNSGDMIFPDRDVHTDQNGKFTLKRIPPKSRLNVRARTNNAAAEPVNVIAGESEGPIRLVVDEKTVCAVRGMIVDEAGQPVPKAKVRLGINLRFGNRGTGFTCDSCAADAEGKFHIGGLWAGDGYDVHVSAKGYEDHGSPKIEGTVGGTHDFGKIVLLSINGFVEGKVLDSSGKPMADVRVFNRGDAPEPLETRTDAVGKFRLQGFRKGLVYVFAEKDGYRFTGLKTTSGAADAVVKMLRTEEPAPQTPAPTATTNEVEQKQESVRKLLVLMLTANDDYVKGRAREKLAALDAKQAGKGNKPPTAKTPPQPKRHDIDKAAEQDVEEVLSLLPQNQNQACQQLRDLARRFADSDPEKALRFVAEAILRARNLDDPARTSELAELGVLASRLGNKEVGAKLVREAADMAGKWTLTDQREWQLDSLAKTIAPVDLPLALGIAKKIKKERRSSCLANIAAGLDDLKLVELVLKDADGWWAGRARGRLAYRIAATRPVEAIRLVENIPSDHGREELTKAAAFGWLATVIASKDSKLAHSLIDRAFAIHLHPSDPSQYLAGERAAQPALLAVHARMAGYPDMDSILYRVLATRLTTKNAWSPVAVQESSVATALFLSLVDRPLAKQMLQAVEPNSDAIGSGYSGIGIRDWLKAWALVDPPHAVELVERQLAAAKHENAKRSVWYDAQEMLELWISDPRDVAKLLTRDYINIFAPDQRL